MCRDALRKAPRSRVTPAQGAQIAALCNTMPRREIAQRVGITHARLNRYLAEQGLRSNARDYPQDMVDAVAQAYASAPPRQGRATVQALFPDVVVRAIVERRHHRRPATTPRQIRWRGEQILDAVRMAGLVSRNAQARYFGRPNAFGGSIRALWTKHFQCAPGAINGLPYHLAWQVATAGVPAVLVKRHDTNGPAAKVLWLDLVDWLRADLDPTIRDALHALARFQAWLHGTTDTHTIRRMIAERETTDGDHDACHDERADGDPAVDHGAAL